jgi:lipopolysaccharide export system permease protein
MRILTKYMLKEMGGPFLGALFVLTLILAAGNIIQTADMVMNKGVDIIDVVKVFFLFLPYVLIFTIPISVLAGVLLGFGRLSGDNEVTAIRTSGISLRKVILPVIICGFIVSLANIPLNDRVLPESEFAARKLLKKIGIANPTALLEPGVFIKGFQDYIIFVHKVDGNKLENIRIYQPREGKATRTIIAESGRVVPLPEENSVKLMLFEGTADEISPENPDEFYKLTFKNYQMTLDLDNAVDTSNIQKKAREKSIKELREEISDLDKASRRVLSLKIELHKKIALAFSNLVFVLAGIPIAITTHRREKFIGFGLAIIIFLLYWGIMLGGIAFAVHGSVPPWLGVWAANIVVLSLGLTLFWKLLRK